MVDVGIITGSGFYDFPQVEKPKEQEVETEFGKANVVVGTLAGKEVAFIARHGKGHALLPNMINHRANISALKKLGAKCVLATTVCGMLKQDIPLAKPIIFSDLYFPDNRLPNGEICTMFTKNTPDKGHYIFGSPFNKAMRDDLVSQNPDAINSGIYSHANGPRFNSASEIKMMQQHADAVSQTAGPEAVLAGELEIPFTLIGFGVDYANGVKNLPTPVEELTKNLARSKEKLGNIIINFIKNLKDTEFDGFVYRFG